MDGLRNDTAKILNELNHFSMYLIRTLNKILSINNLIEEVTNSNHFHMYMYIYMLHIYLQPRIAFGGLGASGENALEDVEMQQEQELAQKK